MNIIFKKFYTSCYKKTGGFIPSMELNLPLYPGDFFQIKNGEFLVLGNVFKSGILEKDEVILEYGLKLNTHAWTFNEGLSKPYSGRGSGQGVIGDDFEYSKQVLALAEKGCFNFKGNNPEAVRISNWADIREKLIIKLTQVCYSFREVYVVTESATTSDWTLAIAGGNNAELEIATSADNFGLVDIFGHESSRTIHLKDIEFYNRQEHRVPVFFKAKRLCVSDERKQQQVATLIGENDRRSEWISSFYDYQYKNEDRPYISRAEGCILDFLQANELNPASALSYFKWVDTNLDDVHKIFSD